MISLETETIFEDPAGGGEFEGMEGTKASTSGASSLKPALELLSAQIDLGKRKTDF